MSEPTGDGRPIMFPCLFYDDAKAAIEWLGKAFGFETKMVVPGPGETIAHAELVLGNGLVMVGTSKGGDLRLKSPRQLGACTQCTYICVADIDALHARAKAAGAQMIGELADTDYGSREFNCRDLEGHFWSFGTYQPLG